VILSKKFSVVLQSLWLQDFFDCRRVLRDWPEGFIECPMRAVEEQIAQRAAKPSTGQVRDDMVDHFILSFSASSFLMLTVNYQEGSCSTI
jgi:hypothetical protein